MVTPASPLNLLLVSVMTAILLLGCQSVEIEQQLQHQARLASFLDEYAVLENKETEEWKSTSYDVLRQHMPNNPDGISADMLASGQKPTPEEKDAIFEWANFGMESTKEKIEIAKQYLNLDYVERFDATLFAMVGKRLELYEGKLTYGEYLAAIKQLDEQFQSDFAELTTYHSELVGRAEQRRARQKESWIRHPERMLERRREEGIQHGPLKCDEIGDFTRCRF